MAHQKDLPTSDRAVRTEDISALKRLLREVFADLLDLKQKVEDLGPKDEEDSVIPYEGAAFAPYSKSLAQGVRLRSRAQLSGTIDAAALFPASTEDGLVVGHALHSWGLTATPNLTLLLQTLWAKNKHGLHAQLITRPDGQGLQLNKLLYRHEPSSGLKLLLAGRGALDNIARNVNPFASGQGLTTHMRKGHGLTMVSEQGLGGALAATRGAGTVAAGHFVSGHALEPVHHSVLQASLHSSSQQVALTAAASLTRRRPVAGSGSAGSAEGSPPHPLGALAAIGGLGHNPLVGSSGFLGLMPLAGPAVADGDGAHGGGADAPPCCLHSCMAARCLQAGVAGSASVRDKAVVSGWAAHSSVGGTRVGVRVATVPDALTGNVAALCLTRELDKRAGLRSVCWLGEACAAMPMADGVVLLPGLAWQRRDGKAVLCAAVKTRWSF